LTGLDSYIVGLMIDFQEKLRLKSLKSWVFIITKRKEPSFYQVTSLIFFDLIHTFEAKLKNKYKVLLITELDTFGWQNKQKKRIYVQD
jgi:hypothetical protein